MDYSGTIFANSDTCDGYLGFVFGYQSNRKFYMAIWRHNHRNFDYAAGIQGLQIKVRKLVLKYPLSPLCIHSRDELRDRLKGMACGDRLW